MNLQRRNLSNTRSGIRKREQKSWIFKFYVLLYLLIVASIFFGAVNYRIDLNRKITELQRARAATKRDMQKMDLDIQALKMQRERLASWDNVKSRIAEYNLPLRESEPHQIRYVALNTASGAEVSRTAAENSYQEQSGSRALSSARY